MAVLIQILRFVALHPHDNKTSALADLVWLTFFFLLQPGEYLWTNHEPHPFLLEDVYFRIQGHDHCAAEIPLELLDNATFVSLDFTEQKNGITNERIGLGLSGDKQACPVHILKCRVRHLRSGGASRTTPLYCYYDSTGLQRYISDRMLTEHLRLAASTIGDLTNYTVGMLRNTGAQALLEAETPLPMLKLIGRWRSDEIFRYLTAQSERFMQPFAERMLRHAP